MYGVINNEILSTIYTLNETLYNCKTGSMLATYGPGAAGLQQGFWTALNDTASKGIGALFLETKPTTTPEAPPGTTEPWIDFYTRGAQLATLNVSGVDWPALFLEALLDPTGEHPVQEILQTGPGLLKIEPYFRSLVPDKKGYMFLMLKKGLPAHQDVGKWWDSVLDDFDIDEDMIWGTAPFQHQGGVEVDGNTVTYEVEWMPSATYMEADGTLEQLEDYEVKFTYSDTGGQSSMEFVGSETFYKTESLAPVIPGYEISILLATAAISAIALIYVVMKKKRM